MMIARLERILYKLAQQHAPHLASRDWLGAPDAPQRIQQMARQLAAYNILVLVADQSALPEAQREEAVRAWIKHCGQFYTLLAQGLFPSIAKISAFYADDQQPPVVVINGQATPVVQVMAGFLQPYLAARQSRLPVSELEVRGLMTTILDEVEADDLPRAVYNQLQQTGADIVQKLLAARIRHISLTVFDRQIISDSEPVQVSFTPPTPPGKLPEQEKLVYELERLPYDESVEPTATEEMFKIELPLEKSRRMPPVPRLPNT